LGTEGSVTTARDVTNLHQKRSETTVFRYPIPALTFRRLELPLGWCIVSDIAVVVWNDLQKSEVGRGIILKRTLHQLWRSYLFRSPFIISIFPSNRDVFL